MESDIDTIIDTYTLFVKYEIVIPQEDYDQAYSLKMNYDQMIQRSKDMSTQIASMQSPLLLELNSGIASFKAEMSTFNSDYETNGPMEPELTAKEASDRVCIILTYLDLLSQAWPFLD